MENPHLSFLVMCLLGAIAVWGGEGAPWPWETRGNQLLLHVAETRKQRLVFVPALPGADIGCRRLSFEGGGDLAELLLPVPLPLPKFQKRLRVEMVIVCAENTTLLSADLRMKDSQGEICALGCDSGDRHTGTIHAVWVIRKDQSFPMAWGSNPNHLLDWPAVIDNFAFRIRGKTGELVLWSLHIEADGE